MTGDKNHKGLPLVALHPWSFRVVDLTGHVSAGDNEMADAGRKTPMVADMTRLKSGWKPHLRSPMSTSFFLPMARTRYTSPAGSRSLAYREPPLPVSVFGLTTCSAITSSSLLYSDYRSPALIDHSERQTSMHRLAHSSTASHLWSRMSCKQVSHRNMRR
jgi:hypothetical protein